MKPLQHQTEAGTVLLTTLLVMAVMAAITIALMDDIRVAVRRTININAYAQADWQGRGAEDFILAFLKTDFAALDPAAQNLFLLQGEPVMLPTQDGLITVRLKDASHCFNLNAILGDESGGTNPAAEFIALAELIGVPRNQADALSKSLMDWIDTDQSPRSGGAEDGTYLRFDPPYRTADTVLTAPEEMRALNGMDEELWELFRPFVCTGGLGALPPINVNTLDVERIAVLVAALGGRDAVSVAQQLLEDRPVQGYADDAFQARVAEWDEAQRNLSGRLSTEVSSLFVEVVTTVGPAERVRTYRYDGVLDTDGPVLTYRGWGRETFRPEIDKKDVR